MIKTGCFIVFEELGETVSTPEGRRQLTTVLDVYYIKNKYMIDTKEAAEKYFNTKNIDRFKVLRMLILEFENDNTNKIWFSKETKEKLKTRFKFESRKEAKDKINNLLYFIRDNVSLTKEEIEDVKQKMGTGQTGLTPYFIGDIYADSNRYITLYESDNYWLDSQKYV